MQIIPLTLLIDQHLFPPEIWVTDLSSLYSQLKAQEIQLTYDAITTITKRNGVYVFVAYENDHIVGCATLCIYPTLHKQQGWIEDVVVDEHTRGRGLGRQLVQYCIDEAKRLGVTELALTSNPKRIAANKLYPAMGFVHHETNCYKYPLG